MLFNRFRTMLIVSALSAMVAGCGGSSGSGTTMSAEGASNISIMDAPGDYDNVWITVSAAWFHTSSTAGPDDAGWVKFSLTNPVTVDLLTLQNGNLVQYFTGLALQPGNYQQIRLFLVGPDSALTVSANSAGLTYNDQVNYQDSTNTEQAAPLELINPDKGVALHGTFNVVAGTTLDLALDFDINRDVLQFFVGNNEDFVLNPRLHYFNLSNVGAISGSVDCANLVSGGGFAYNLVIKAEMLSADGSHYVVDRETTLNVDRANNSCTFALFPLDIPSGATSTNYDVMIRGRDMDTIFVQNVPVLAGTTAATGTALNQTPITLTAGAEYTANMPANMPVSPTGAHVNFYQTLTGLMPYEIRYRDVNPFSGIFMEDEPLSTGPLQVGAYVSDGDPVLTGTTPVEGLGGFDPYGGAPYFTRTEATTGILTPPVAGAGSFTIDALSITSPAVADSISGTLTQASGKFDSGYLIVSHDGYIVTTLPLGTVLAQNGNTGGPFSIANIPGGSPTVSFGNGLYYLHAIVWNSAHPWLTLHRQLVEAVVDLDNGSATGVDLTLN